MTTTTQSSVDGGFHLIVTIRALDLVQVLTGEMFFCFSFKVFAKKLFPDDSTNWVNLFCLGACGGTCVSVHAGRLFGLWCVCTLGSL